MTSCFYRTTEITSRPQRDKFSLVKYRHEGKHLVQMDKWAETHMLWFIFLLLWRTWMVCLLLQVCVCCLIFFFLQTFLTSLLCVFIWMIRGIYLFLFSSLCLKFWSIPCEADTLGNWREVPADDDGVAQTLWLCLCPWYSLSSSQSLSLYLIISLLCGSENISVEKSRVKHIS